MTDAELLKRARVFDAGPPPEFNCYVFDEDDDDKVRSLTVEYRGSTGWAICLGPHRCLNKKTGQLVYEPMPSHRSDRFIAETRFASPAKAFGFLEEWKPRLREKALRAGMIRWKDQLAAWAKEKEANL